MTEPYETNLMCIDGPFRGAMQKNVKLTSGPGEVITITVGEKDCKYRLLDGPALQAAMKTKKAHPNLSASCTFVQEG